MRPSHSLLSLALAGVAAACGSIPNEPPVGSELAPTGVLRGTVVYNGPHPCSSNGHIVGAAIVYVFDRRNPPPPNGLATAPVNFGVVTGDALFAAEPRNQGPSTYCPSQNGITDTITTNAPFAISPVPGGEYLVQSFYDYTGDYLPNYSFRNLPELGDVGGGIVDTADALKPSNAGNPNYQPVFLPVDVGIPQAGAIDGGIPNFVVPPQGFVADNLTVTVGEVLTSTRPYFYPGGMSVSFDSGSGVLSATEVQTSATAATSAKGIANTTQTNPDLEPILTIPQDIAVLAAPTQSTEGNVNSFESKLPRLLLHTSVPAAEVPVAMAEPFHFQVWPAGAPPVANQANQGMFHVWQDALFDPTKQKWVPQDIPEGGGIPSLWPLVVLTKLDTSTGPTSIKAQGDATHPVVILQGITLLGGDGTGDPTKTDSLFNSATAEAFGSLFDPGSGQANVFAQDHLTVVVRPAAICFNTLFDATNPDKRGTLVTPHIMAQTADVVQPTPPTTASIVPVSVFSSPQLAALVKGTPAEACLPTGRYAINVVYPDGQAWTVPNEAGVCSGVEGSTDYAKLSCTLQPRPVLRSQSARAVVEITPATNPAHCAAALPPACQAAVAP